MSCVERCKNRFSEKCANCLQPDGIGGFKQVNFDGGDAEVSFSTAVKPPVKEDWKIHYPVSDGLANLAKRLKDKIEHHGYAFESQKQDDIMAQRIVEELANVEGDHMGYPWFDHAALAVKRSRSIANGEL